MTDKNKPFESGDLQKDHALAREEVNRSAVHVQDSMRKAFERMAKAGNKKEDLSAMAGIQKDLDKVLEDIDAIAAEDPAPKEKAKAGDEPNK